MPAFLRYATDRDETRLLDDAERRRYGDGDVIVREGERSRRLYILRSGRARVERSHGEFNVEISRLGEGELFGEMGFVEDFPASASVVADGECSVDIIDEARVHAMVNGDPEFAGRFYRSVAELLSRRLRATSVEALSEFSWGTGRFQRLESGADAEEEPPQRTSWGGGSPLRDRDAG